ncbi:mechanosensitive ion channel family protein [Patescibacteria group bacterium]
MFANIFPATFWDKIILGNTVDSYVTAILLLFILIIVFKIFQNILLSRLKAAAEKTATEIDDIFIHIVDKIKPPFYTFVAFYFAIKYLTIHGAIQKLIDVILIFWVVYQAIDAIQILINFVVFKKLRKEKDEDKTAVQVIGFIIKIVLWSIGLLFVLSNLGVDVTSLIAGLGIGGVAIALALQNILADLFSYFAIHFDKPFKVGDFIVIGDKRGTVEKIGIKTTRLRSMQGEELIISNKEMTSAQIQNFKNMEERRIVMNFGVTYETPSKKLETIPNLVKDVIDSVPKTRLDRIHFKSFGDSALDFEVVFYFDSTEYVDYMDAQQEINFRLKRDFERAKIDMAYPTQTLYLKK